MVLWENGKSKLFFMRFHHCFCFEMGPTVEKLSISQLCRFWPKFGVFSRKPRKLQIIQENSLVLNFSPKVLTHTIFWKKKSLKVWVFYAFNYEKLHFFRRQLWKMLKPQVLGEIQSLKLRILCFSTSFDGWDLEVLMHG